MLSTLVVSFLLASSSVFAAHLHPHGKRADLSIAPATATATQVAVASSNGSGKLLTTKAGPVQSTGVEAILESIVGTDPAALASASAYAASYVAGGGDLASLIGGNTALATATAAAPGASEVVASALNYPNSAAASGSASSAVNPAGVALSSASASASAASSSLTGSAHRSTTQDGGFLVVVALGAMAASFSLL